MTLFSFVILSVLLNFLRRYRKVEDLFIHLTAFSIALEVMLSIGNFIDINEIDVGYSEFLICIDSILSIVIILNKSHSNKILFSGLLLVFSCCFSLLFQYIFPFMENVVSHAAEWDLLYFHGNHIGKIQIGFKHYKEIFHVICYVSIFIAVQSLNRHKLDSLILFTYKYQIPFILFGTLELILVKFFDCQYILNTVEAYVFGNNYICFDCLLSLGVDSRLKGLKSEPSMYGFALFIFFASSLFLSIKYNDKKMKYYAILSFVLLYSSFSLTSIVVLVIFITYFILFYFFLSKRNTKIIMVILLPIMAFLFICLLSYIYTNKFDNYYLNRIHLALINFDDLSIDSWLGDYENYDGSSKVRMISIIGSFEYFIQRPLFGLALGSTYAHSTMTTLIASIGSIGCFIWYYFTFGSLTSLQKPFYFCVTFIWCLVLVIIGDGLFPFYGIKNVVIVYFLNLFYQFYLSKSLYKKSYLRLFRNTL